MLYPCLALILAAGCATTPRVGPELSEKIRHLAELRETCTQYAAWLARDYSEAPEFQEAHRLYIEASAAANAYIEALQFDLTTGAAISADKYAKVETKVDETSRAFLEYAVEMTAPKTRGGKARGLPLVLPALGNLLELGLRLNDAIRGANARQRELIVQTLESKKWQPMNDLRR